MRLHANLLHGAAAMSADGPHDDYRLREDHATHLQSVRLVRPRFRRTALASLESTRAGDGRLPGIRRIAVLRAGGLGDFVFALPALQALRESYPGASISLLTGPAQGELLESRPGPWDEVLVVPPFAGVRDDAPALIEEAEAFFQGMQARRFDLAVQMHGGGRHSNAFIHRLGAAFTVGCRTPDALPLDRWMPHVYLHSEVARWLELVALVGASPRGLAPALEVTPRDRAEAAAAGPRRGLEVTLHPGAGSPRRRWPAERVAAVGDRLAEAGATVYVVGAAVERDLTAAVTAQMRHPARDLGGQLSLRGLVGLFDRAALHVGNDSGPAHLARAVGAPTLAVFWGPNMLTAGPIGPADRHRTVLSWCVQCPECGERLVERECGHNSSLVAEVPVEAVAREALDLLDLHARSRPAVEAPQVAAGGADAGLASG